VRRGLYVLLIELEEPTAIVVGRLGELRFEAGWYAYVGSAMGGLDARVARHLRAEKRVRWHIDYLLAEARVAQVLEIETSRRLECELSDVVARAAEVTPGATGFGSSDCGCITHLHSLGGCEGVAAVVEQVRTWAVPREGWAAGVVVS